jgi:hypothetical protein
MDTLLIEVTSQKAYQLLRQLEELHIIRVLKKRSANKLKPSEKYSGTLGLTDEEYTSFHQHLKQGRSTEVFSN